jgi:hypothetical protein
MATPDGHDARQLFSQNHRQAACGAQMFDAVKRWLFSDHGGAGEEGLAAVETWAKRAGLRFRKAPDQARFVIESTASGCDLRMEWGPSQRDYIAPNELRLRMDLNLPGGFQMLLLTLPLMEKLEGATFDRFTQAAQTMLDMSTPEEMRWLAMFPKVDLSWDKALRAQFCVLGADPELTLAWIKGGLADQLLQASQDLLQQSPPFLLMTMRGRLYLRMQLAEPSPAALAQCVEIFDAALKSATSLGKQMEPDPAGSPSTLSTGAHSHTQPSDPDDSVLR